MEVSIMVSETLAVRDEPVKCNISDTATLRSSCRVCSAVTGRMRVWTISIIYVINARSTKLCYCTFVFFFRSVALFDTQPIDNKR